MRSGTRTTSLSDRSGAVRDLSGKSGSAWLSGNCLTAFTAGKRFSEFSSVGPSPSESGSLRWTRHWSGSARRVMVTEITVLC